MENFLLYFCATESVIGVTLYCSHNIFLKLELHQSSWFFPVFRIRTYSIYYGSGSADPQLRNTDPDPGAIMDPTEQYFVKIGKQ
jgi:hypothetical protein